MEGQALDVSVTNYIIDVFSKTLYHEDEKEREKWIFLLNALGDINKNGEEVKGRK